MPTERKIPGSNPGKLVLFLRNLLYIASERHQNFSIRVSVTCALLCPDRKVLKRKIIYISNNLDLNAILMEYDIILLLNGATIE